MKVLVKKGDIIDVLSKIQGLTGRKSNLAITENVLLRAAGNGLNLTATDLESGFEGMYPATVEAEGSIAINARKFFEIIKNYPDEDININEIENRWIEIGNQKVMYHIVGMNPEDFPDSPHIEDIQFFEIPSDTLKKMIEKTIMISGAADEKRAHITGVYLENIKKGDDNKIRMVSTDGSRLTAVDYPYGKDIKFALDTSVIIPKKGLSEVHKFLEPETTIQFGLKHNHFIIKRDAETIIIRLLEGEFPEYQDIIKKHEKQLITVSRQLFLAMLKRMSILSSESYKGAIFHFEDDTLTVTTTNPDIGESKEQMSITYSRDTMEIAFNPKYFIETLNVIDDDNVSFNIIDDEHPCIIEGEKDKHFISVIMPMRI